MTKNSKNPETQAVHLGRDPLAQNGFVNPPTYRGSTVIQPSVEAFEEAQANKFTHGRIVYGTFGTPHGLALDRTIAEMEGAHDAVSVCSGLAAISTAMLAFVESGDHILVADSVYYPTRSFCSETLARLGVDTTYYNPVIGSDIESLIQPNTRLIYLESPGSLTFEIQDIPAITAIAQQRNIVTLLDNTWGTPLYFKTFDHGVDVSIHAATKYIVGHADALLGMICANEKHFETIKMSASRLGQCAGPDDVALALRGLRTMPLRLKQHEQQALKLAIWLEAQPQVSSVLHPALESHPGHELWKRDFLGSCGLFGVVLSDIPKHAVSAMLNDMSLFSLGASWGGFESLILPMHPETFRQFKTWDDSGPLLRIHAGLENLEDLKDDLASGFERLNLAAQKTA
ncbi:MAG: cystathionine beta-lyase [Gammaproteobacteria bacterium]|nr:cystathionine beta-lyase [Gammaproteobacteria bacterium]